MEPSTLPTLAPSNNSQLVKPRSSPDALEGQVVAVILSPGGAVGMAAFGLLLMLVALICYCERSLARQALAARMANTEKIKADRRKAAGIPAKEISRKYSTSPFRKVTNFFAPRKYPEELEVIL